MRDELGLRVVAKRAGECSFPAELTPTFARVQLSKRTRFKFGEFATGYAVLREIDRVFISEDFEPVPDWENLESGMRRSLVAGYHESVDFSDPAQVGRLLRVYADAINSHRAGSTGRGQSVR